MRYIREQYGDYFCIGVAGYPEGHVDSTDKSVDLQHLKAKVDAGADFIVTQLFYDISAFETWIKACREIGKKDGEKGGISDLSVCMLSKNLDTEKKALAYQLSLASCPYPHTRSFDASSISARLKYRRISWKLWMKLGCVLGIVTRLDTVIEGGGIER